MRLERACERVAAVLEHRLAVRDEDHLDREIEERSKRGAELAGIGSVGEPRVGAEADAARSVPEKHVPGDQRAVRGQPKEDFVGAEGFDRDGAAGKRVAEPERVRDARFQTIERPLVRPERRAWIALDYLVRAPLVPEDGEKDGRGPEPLGVSVERAPETVALRRPGGRRQGVDEDELVRRLVVEAPDVPLPAVGASLLRCPVGVRRGPAPEPRSKLEEVHAV